MAIFDTGVFMPAESSYTDPIASREALRAEGVKHAAYLSSMDQFYAELEEMQRQFNANLGYKQDVLSFEREKFAKTLAWDKEKSAKQFELEEKKIDVAERAAGADEMTDMEKRIQLRESRYLQDYWTNVSNKSAEMTNKIVDKYVGGNTAARTTTPARTEIGLDLTQVGAGNPNIYNPYSGQSISNFFNK